MDGCLTPREKTKPPIHKRLDDHPKHYSLPRGPERKKKSLLMAENYYVTTSRCVNPCPNPQTQNTTPTHPKRLVHPAGHPGVYHHPMAPTHRCNNNSWLSAFYYMSWLSSSRSLPPWVATIGPFPPPPPPPRDVFKTRGLRKWCARAARAPRLFAPSSRSNEKGENENVWEKAVWGG